MTERFKKTYLPHEQPASPPQHAPPQTHVEQTQVPEVAQPHSQPAQPPEEQQALADEETRLTADDSHATFAAQQAFLFDFAMDLLATWALVAQHLQAHFSHLHSPVAQQPQQEQSAQLQVAVVVGEPVRIPAKAKSADAIIV